MRPSMASALAVAAATAASSVSSTTSPRTGPCAASVEQARSSRTASMSHSTARAPDMSSRSAVA